MQNHNRIWHRIGLFVVIFILIGAYRSQPIGHPIGDMLDHIWGHEWLLSSLQEGTLPYQTKQTHLPKGGWLWHIDPIGSLLYIPLRFLGYIGAWNGMLSLQIWLFALVLMEGYFREEKRRSVAFLLSLLLALSPYTLGLLHSGLSEYVGLFFPGLLIYLHHGDPTSRKWKYKGVLIFLSTLQAFYYGAFACLFLCCTIRKKEEIRGVVLSIATGTLLSTPLIYWVWLSTHAPEAAFLSQHAPGWSYKNLPAIDLLSWIRPGKWYSPDTPKFGNPGILQVNYLGWILLGIAAWGIRTKESIALMKRCWPFLVLALGPVLAFNRIIFWKGGVILPLGWLYGFPVIAQIHHPYRIVSFVIPILGLLAWYGLRKMPARIAVPLLLCGLVETLTVSPSPWPIAQGESITVPTLPERPGHVLNWPPDNTRVRRMALLAQLQHKRGIAMGINQNIAVDLYRSAELQSLYRCLSNPTMLARNRDVHHPKPRLPRQASEGYLQQKGFRWLLYHKGVLRDKDATCTQTWLNENCAEKKENADVTLCTLPSF